MNLQHFIYFYLWIAPHVLLIAVAALMFRKGLYKDFPIFFSYLLFEFLQFCLLCTIYCLALTHSLEVTAGMYGKIDIFGRAGSIALHFGILQEMFEWPVAHSVSLRRSATRILKWVTAFLVVLASLFIGSLYYSSIGHRLLPAYATFEALNTAQCGVLVLVFLWHRFLGLGMSPFVFGIAVGIGLTAGLEPLIHAWKDSLAVQNSRVPDLLQMVIFHAAVVIWLCVAQAREKITSNSKAAPLPQVRELAADMGRIIHQ